MDSWEMDLIKYQFWLLLWGSDLFWNDQIATKNPCMQIWLFLQINLSPFNFLSQIYTFALVSRGKQVCPPHRE